MSNAAVIENYQVGHRIAHDYYNITEASNVKQWSNIPSPPRVQLNDHAINDVHKALLELHIISYLLFNIISMYFSQRTCNFIVTFAQILSFIYWHNNKQWIFSGITDGKIEMKKILISCFEHCVEFGLMHDLTLHYVRSVRSGYVKFL